MPMESKYAPAFSIRRVFLSANRWPPDQVKAFAGACADMLVDGYMEIDGINQGAQAERRDALGSATAVACRLSVHFPSVMT
jgi:hypothetical protein